MDSYSTKIMRWYKRVFDDADLFFLLVVTLGVSIFYGFLIKNNFLINGGSIFIVCGAAIAGVLSFLAIETSREIKEKEIERKDIERLGDTCFDLNIKLLDYKRSCAKSIAALEDREEINSSFTKAYTQIRQVKKAIVEGQEKDEDVAGKLKREKSLSERGSFLYEKLKEADGLVNDSVDVCYDRFDQFIRVANKAKLISQSIKYNHELESIDLARLIDHLENYTKACINAKQVFLSNVKFRLSDEKDDDIVEVKKAQDLPFPTDVEIYEEVEALYMCPGLKVGSQSIKYLVTKNRCISIALFFAVIAVINGFTIR